MTWSWFVSRRHARAYLPVTVVVLAVGATLGNPAAALAAAGGEGGGIITLNRTLFVQVLNFVILLGVLYVVAYKPLLRTLETRSTTIRQQLTEAQAAREQAQHQLAELERRLQAAQADAQAVRDRALREAAETRERLGTEAREEATRLLAAARAEIEQDVRRAKTELRAEVGTLAVQIAERVIQRSLREEDQQRLIQDALTRIDSA